MATPTFTLLNHTSLTTADTNTGWSDLTTADPDVKVEGSNAMSGIFRADAEQGYYDAGGAPVTAVGKTLRGWINTTNIAYMATEANGGYSLLAFDGTTEELKTIFGSDTYGGGWFNYIWDMDDFTTLTLANVDRWGVEAGHASSAKNVTNTWMDVIRYLDGYSMTGGTSSDDIELSDIATLDYTSAYGVLSEFEGVYFATGTVQFGTGATTTYAAMDGEVLVFTDQHVAAGLYKLSGVGTGSTVAITDSVLRSTGSTDATRFILDFDDADLASLTLTGNLIVRAATSSFKSGQTVTGNVFDDCGQITHGGADMQRCDVTNYSGTPAAAMVYNETADPSGELDDCTFTKGSATKHAIEFGTSSPTSITLDGLTFSGYNSSNAQADSTLYFARTGGTVTVNLSGVTGNVSYKTAGATISLVNSTTLELTGLKNPTEVRVYDEGTTTEIAGQEDVTTGTYSTGVDAATYPDVDIAVVALAYQNVRYLAIDCTSDRSIPVSQVIDRQYENP